MTKTTCPFCFSHIDAQRLAYQCTGSGPQACVKESDPERVQKARTNIETFPTFLPDTKTSDPISCPKCGGTAKRRACPSCHMPLPIEFADAKSPMIGLVGAKGSGKTVLMTVLVKHLRDVVGRRFGADITIMNDNPDGHDSLAAYQSMREASLYDDRVLPGGTNQAMVARRTPIVVRWRQERARRIGAPSLHSTVLSFVDTAGEDLNDLETAFTLQYLSVADGLMLVLDPFTLPGARMNLQLHDDAVQVTDGATIAIVSRITELLRTEHNVKTKRKVPIPLAVVFTKMDAFFSTLEPGHPLMAAATSTNAYDEAMGQAVHEHMLALLHRWHADDIDNHLKLNYSDYRYFGVSALGAEPDYSTKRVAPGGVQPHRVEDPVLWLLAKSRTLPST